MTLRFLVDAQLPLALAKFLRTSGYDADHVSDVGLLRAKDPPIWAYAHQHKYVIVSKDEDFSILRILRTDGPQVVWLRIGNCTKAALIQWFAPKLQNVVTRLQAGETLIELI
jgi:predicted nuclease of predicted toxin-antitoxin system